jgi:hypothetical protein
MSVMTTGGRLTCRAVESTSRDMIMTGRPRQVALDHPGMARAVAREAVSAVKTRPRDRPRGRKP